MSGRMRTVGFSGGGRRYERKEGIINEFEERRNIQEGREGNNISDEGKDMKLELSYKIC